MELKGTPSQEVIFARKLRKCESMSNCRLRMVVLSVFIEHKYFGACKLSSSRSSHVGSLVTNGEQKSALSSRSMAVAHIPPALAVWCFH